MLKDVLDRIFHIGTMEVEAVVESVALDNRTFIAILPNTRNGLGPFRATLRIRPGQKVPRRGQIVYVNARIHSIRIG